MLAMVPNGFFVTGDASPTQDQAADAHNRTLAFIRQMPGGAPGAMVTVPATGWFEPQCAMNWLITPGHAPTASLYWMNVANVPIGAILELGVANSGETINIINASGVAGQIYLATGANFAMTIGMTLRLLLWNQGLLIEIGRSYGGDDTAMRTALKLQDGAVMRRATGPEAMGDSNGVLITPASMWVGMTDVNHTMIRFGDLGLASGSDILPIARWDGTKWTQHYVWQQNLVPSQWVELGEAGVPGGAGGTVPMSHALNRVAHATDVMLRCKIAEGGFNVGEETRAFIDTQNNAVCWAVRSGYNFVQVLQSRIPNILRADTAAIMQVTPANWRWVARVS